MSRKKTTCLLGLIACVALWHTGCIGSVKSRMADNGKYVFSFGTTVSPGHETSATQAVATTDTTLPVEPDAAGADVAGGGGIPELIDRSTDDADGMPGMTNVG